MYPFSGHSIDIRVNQNTRNAVSHQPPCLHDIVIGRRYRNDPKFLDRQVWANSADPDQTAPRGRLGLRLGLESDQGLHCLLLQYLF